LLRDVTDKGGLSAILGIFPGFCYPFLVRGIAEPSAPAVRITFCGPCSQDPGNFAVFPATWKQA